MRSVEVSVIFTPNTASSGGDFSPMPQFLTFSGQNTELCISVSITEDQFFEDDESFFADLETTESVQFVQLTIFRAVVIITNDDGNF